MADLVEMSGRKFGGLLVRGLAQVKPRMSSCAFWEVLCCCGNSFVTSGSDLRLGKVKSCGCSRSLARKHGQVKTRSYRSWQNMMTRCYNSQRLQFKDYGGRGISVCDRWHDPSNFIADMGQPPDGTTLDRIDTDGNYEPSNCRWATKIQQAQNMRSNVHITIRGDKRILSEWCRHYRINISTVKTRVSGGMSWELALTTPLRRRGAQAFDRAKAARQDR